MGLWKDKIRKDWCYSFQYQGEMYAGRGHDTRRDAESARADRRKKVKEGERQEQTVTAFSVLANSYLDHAQRKFVSGTYKRKVNVCSRFIISQGDLPIDQITPLQIHAYLSSLPTNNLYNEHREELSTAFNWIKRTYSSEYPFLANPCLAVDTMPTVESEKEIPTTEDVQRILAAAKPGDEKDLIICCVQLLGRIDEILRLRWKEDVNFERKIITLWTRKRKDGAYESNPMPMSDELHSILWSRWQRCQKVNATEKDKEIKKKREKWVFYNESTEDRYYKRPRLMASVCQRAGITPIGKGRRKLWRGKNKGQYIDVPLYYGFHSLRHFMASLLADQDKISLKTVSGLLRHKNVRTTERYLHHLDPSHRAAIEQIGMVFTSKKEDPQPIPATNK